MNVLGVAGLLTGIVGLGLAALGLLVALLAGLRLLVVLRRPAQGRIARGVGAAGLVLLLCGAVLLAAEELDLFRHAVDRAALGYGGVALLLSIYAGVRAGRRKAAQAEAVAPAEVEVASGAGKAGEPPATA